MPREPKDRAYMKFHAIKTERLKELYFEKLAKFERMRQHLSDMQVELYRRECKQKGGR